MIGLFQIFLEGIILMQIQIIYGFFFLICSKEYNYSFFFTTGFAYIATIVVYIINCNFHYVFFIVLCKNVIIRQKKKIINTFPRECVVWIMWYLHDYGSPMKLYFSKHVGVQRTVLITKYK